MTEGRVNFAELRNGYRTIIEMLEASVAKTRAARSELDASAGAWQKHTAGSRQEGTNDVVGCMSTYSSKIDDGIAAGEEALRVMKRIMMNL